MSQVTVSSKYQLIIPREIRRKLNIKKGQKMLALAVGNRIEYVPDRDISEMEGIFPGLSSDDIREETDRF